MSMTLNVRTAVREANEAFRRYWLQFSLPLVAIGAAMWVAEVAIHRLFGKGAAVWVGLVPVFGCVVAEYAAELVVATMYLDLKVGANPSLGLARRAIGYRGSWGVIWGLLVRGAGWFVVVGLGTIVVMFLWFFVMSFVKAVAGHASGVGALAGGSSGLVLVVFPLFFAMAYSRYLFVVPTVALLGDGAGPRVIRETEIRTRPVRGTALLLAAVQSLPGIVLALLQRLMFPGLDPYHGGRIGAGLAVAIVEGVYFSWFVLVRTGLAAQLLERTAISRLSPSAPWAGTLAGQESTG